MKKLIRYIGHMWHWELAHENRKEFITAGIEMAIIFIVFLLYKLGKRYLFIGTRILREIPTPFLALLGLDANTEMGNIAFFLMYVLLLLNLRNIWYYGRHMIHTIDRDEISGSIYIICGQWFNRTQISWSKWGFNVLWVVIEQSLLYIWTILWMLIGSTNNSQRIHYLGQLSASWGISICMMILFISLCFFYAVFPKRNLRKTVSGFLNKLFWILLILANLYKIKDILFFLLEYLEGLEIDIERFMKMFSWLNQLGQIVPLKLINPFANSNPMYIFIQLAVCLCLSAAAVAGGIRFYRKREFLG